MREEPRRGRDVEREPPGGGRRREEEGEHEERGHGETRTRERDGA
jgi:hypothetical protein